MSPLNFPYVKPRFIFESYWAQMQGFQDCVQQVWVRSIPISTNPLLNLHIKMSRVAKALKDWSKSLVSERKLAMAICREVIDRLNRFQEFRALSEGERKLVKDLQLRILGMVAIEKCMAKQKSRLNWMRVGDANTKFFHLMANSSKKKNFIQRLQSTNGLAISYQEKHRVIFYHYLKHTGTYVPRAYSLNLSGLAKTTEPP
jgi:hypothetical protein